MKDVIMNQNVIIENQIDDFKVIYVSNDEKRKKLEKVILDFFISNDVLEELVEELHEIMNFDVQFIDDE